MDVDARSLEKADEEHHKAIDAAISAYQLASAQAREAYHKALRQAEADYKKALEPSRYLRRPGKKRTGSLRSACAGKLPYRQIYHRLGFSCGPQSWLHDKYHSKKIQTAQILITARRSFTAGDFAAIFRPQGDDGACQNFTRR